MMNSTEIIDMIVQNLINTGWAMLLFLICYLANMIFSLFLNIGKIGQAFDIHKFLQSIVKALVFVVGLTLLVIGVTMIPKFAQLMNWTVPEDFTQIFSGLAIIGSILYPTCLYAKEAFEKANDILKFKPENFIDEIIAAQNDKAEKAKKKEAEEAAEKAEEVSIWTDWQAETSEKEKPEDSKEAKAEAKTTAEDLAEDVENTPAPENYEKVEEGEVEKVEESEADVSDDAVNFKKLFNTTF